MSIIWTSGLSDVGEPYEMDGTAVENFGRESLSASVQLKCPWDQRHEIMYDMIFNRVAWPYLDHDGLVATSASAVAFTGSVGVQDLYGYEYELALLSIQFATDSREEGEDETLYSESLEPTAEFLTIPPTDYRWGSSAGTALKQEEAPGRLEVGFDYVVTRYRLPTIPSWVLTLNGKCNSGSVVSPSLGLTFASEHLMFNPPAISREVTLDGDNLYTLQTRLTFRGNGGWNYFWRPETGAYEQIYHKDGGVYKNFIPASFAGVLP